MMEQRDHAPPLLIAHLNDVNNTWTHRKVTLQRFRPAHFLESRTPELLKTYEQVTPQHARRKPDAQLTLLRSNSKDNDSTNSIPLIMNMTKPSKKRREKTNILIFRQPYLEMDVTTALIGQSYTLDCGDPTGHTEKLGHFFLGIRHSPASSDLKQS